MNIRKKLREELLNKTGVVGLKLYHGTNKKHLNSIKTNGLESTNGKYDLPEWFVLSTDFESALYHATPEDNNSDVYVVEFTIPISNDAEWFGYPYLWPEFKRGGDSSWFALKQPIKNKYITKIHQVTHNQWSTQKSVGY